ncbi:MAG TPA: PAS domain S-box protein [Smithella sp.]|nr:PAS domain S-box protein [Smithella sp.]
MENNTGSKSDKQSRLHVLILDDSEDDAMLIVRELVKGGYKPVYDRIESATALQTALQEKPWDIILCDYSMPGFNAPAAINLLKKSRADIPIIIVSGTVGEETAIECMRLGAQDYVMKTNLSRLCPAIAREIEETKNKRNQNIAEAKLRQSEEKYRNILEHMQEGYFEVDLAGNFIFLNNTVCKTLGYSREELIGMNNRQYTDEKELKKIFQAYNNVYTTGKPIQELTWIVHQKNGGKRYIAGSVSLKKDEAGKPIGFTGMVRDVTEQKQIEEKLREEERRFRTLADQSSDIILLVNRNGIITYENKAVHKILGYQPEERIGANASYNIHPDDLKNNTEEFRKIFADANAPVLRTEVRIRHKDGSWRTFEEVASSLSRDHFVELVIINLRDITERKRFEEALRKSELMFRSLFQNNPVGVFLLKDRKFLEVNPALCKMTGYAPEELIGQSVSVGYSSDQEFERAGKILYKQVLEKGSGFTEARLKRKTGEIFEALLYIAPVDPQDSSLGYEGAMLDITERKKTENALRESERKYRNIFENAMEGIYQATNEGDFITVNTAFARMAGYESPKDLIESIRNISTQLYVHPEDRERFLGIRKTKGFVDNFEVEFYKKDGSTFWVVINARAVKDDAGNALYTEGLIEDITLRKRAEEDLRESLERLKKAVNTTIQVLVSALEVRDPYTAGHQSRSADLACAIAAEMGLSQEKIDGIRMAGVIHDIGKISIPVEILSKPSKLTNLEFSLIKEHSQSGFEMLKDIDSPWPLAEIVQQHHERINGTGYPKNLKGDEILLEARILTVADVVEAMASHRPYRASLGIETALEEIEKNKGILYDEAVANACLKLFREKGYVLE